MTKAEFLQRLRETPRLWKSLQIFTRNGTALRIGDEFMGLCPIAAVCNGRFDTEHWHDGARFLGLDIYEASSIVDAADGLPGSSPQLRAELFDACGLTPVSIYQPNDAAFLASVRALSQQPLVPVED